MTIRDKMTVQKLQINETSLMVLSIDVTKALLAAAVDCKGFTVLDLHWLG
jgi:hypothetical protein